MSDENIQDDHPEIPPKSAPRPEREPVVIEGEATDLTPPEHPRVETETQGEAVAEELTAHATSTEPAGIAAGEGEAAEPLAEVAPEPTLAPEPEPVVEPKAEEPPPPPPPLEPAVAPPRSSGFGAANILGLVAVLVIAVVVAYFAPVLTGDKAANDERFAAIDDALKNETAARQALEARVAKLESTAVSSQALAAVAADAKAARAAADKATTSTPMAAAAAPKTSPAPTAVAAAPAPAPAPVAVAPAPVAPPTPDPEVAKLAAGEGALSDRIAKLESALAAQKSEARAEPVAKVKALDPIAEAVAAISLVQRLAEGAPYPAEFDALSKSGADAGALAALKPYADTGAPTPRKLAAAFAALTPALTAPPKAAGQGEIVDQVVDKLRGLVKVHAVGEIPGDDPTALASQVSAALARGDVAAALATEAKLPDGARAAAAGWAKDAAGLESATAAARSIAETALKRFADAKS